MKIGIGNWARPFASAWRVLAFTLVVCATGQSWAATSLEETGATVPTTATLAFKGATLSQVSADTLSAAFGGSSAGAATGAAPTFNNFDRTSEASGTITCQAQVADDGYIKSVLLTFTQSGSDVNVQKTAAKYITGSAVGPSTASGSTGNYDINKLKLTLGKPTPIAVFDGASGGFKKTSINGVTFAANGNTVADDGSYVKISASVGALFKLSQGYSYVVGEFTVTNLNESAAADRVLALWSPAEDGTHAYTPGVALANGGVTTRGVWNNIIWSNTSFNGALATGTSTDTSRTFALTTEDSSGYNNTGTHLFELTGTNPGTAVYGGTGDMGLRGAQTYRTFVIGGPATGSLSAMTGLVITKVVIYASGSREFVSKATTTIADVENPAAFYVGNGETINASAINGGVTASGSSWVYTEAGATLNLDAGLMGRATFTGSISGTLASTDGLTLGSASDKVTLTSASYVPVIKGRGTVVYPDNTIPSSDSAAWLTSSDWAGTLSLSNIQGSSSGQPGWYAPFHNYGSANSTIKVSGFTGFFGAGNLESPAALEIAAGSTFTLNNGNNGNSMTFAKLKGSGDIVICGNNGPAIQYVMRDASEFAGNITVSQSGSSSFKKSIVLGGGSSYNYNTSKYQKQICVLGNVTIAAGKTWVADSGIVVDGTLTLAASDSSMPAVASGTGKIVCNNKVPNNSGLTASTWTGTLEINADTTNGTISGSTQFMNAASKLNLAEGYLSLTGVSELPGEVSVASGAILYLGKTDMTTASVKVRTLDGAISTQFATSMETLNLDLGTARTFDWTKINQGNNQNLTVNISLTEAPGEDSTIVFTPANFNGNNTYNYTIKNSYGAEVSATTVVDGETGAVTFTFAPQTYGAACWFDFTFTNTLYSATGSSNAGSALTDDHTGTTTTPAEGYGTLTDFAENEYSALKSYRRPYGGINLGQYNQFAVALFGTMPATDNTILACFGTCHGKAILLTSGTSGNEGKLWYYDNSLADDDKLKELKNMAATSARDVPHLYIFQKVGEHQIDIYLDGKLAVSYVDNNVTFTIGSGLQIASGYGKTPAGLNAVNKNGSDTTSMIAMARLYNRALSIKEIRQLASEWPYYSPNGNSERELEAEETTADWAQENKWLVNGVEDDAPKTGSQVVLRNGAGAAATVSVNLEENTNYESLTLEGANAITMSLSGGYTGKIIPATTVIDTDLTVAYNAVDLSQGPVSIADGRTLTFNVSSLIQASWGQSNNLDLHIQLTGVTTLGDGAAVTVTPATIGTWNFEATPDAGGNYYLEAVKIRDNATIYMQNTNGGGVCNVDWTGLNDGSATFTLDAAGTEQTPYYVGDTVKIVASNMYLWLKDTVPAVSFAIGDSQNNTTVRFGKSGSGATYTMSGLSVEIADGSVLQVNNKDSGTWYQDLTPVVHNCTISGDGLVEISSDMTSVTFDSTTTVSAQVTGDGRIVFDGALPTSSTLLTSLQDSSNWTGTVEIKNYTETAGTHKIIVLTKYGNGSSTVALNGVTSTMFANTSASSGNYPDVTLKEIEIGEGGWTDNDNLTYGVNMLYKANLTGSGTIMVKTGDTGTIQFVGGNHTFNGSVVFGDNTGKQVAFMKSASDSLPSVTAKAIVVADGVNMSIASGKSWTAPGGISVCGTLKADGSAPISGSVVVFETGTLDISGFTGAAPAIPGALTLADGATLKLPAGVTLPYKIAASGTACIITGNYTIGEQAGTESGLALTEDGYLDAANVATIVTDTVLSNLEAGGKYLYKVTANATVDVSGVAANVGIVQFIVNTGVRLKLSGEPACPYSISGDVFAIAENDNRHFTATAAAEFYPSIGTLSSSGTTITIDNASSLSTGAYPLARWITPQKKSTGYGHVATLVTTGLADGLTAELVYCVDRVVLRVYDTAAQAAKGTLKVWPFGDSITEGFNAGGTKANYRVLLAQKLSMLGFNVEMVGCYDKINGADAIDPAGQVVLDAWKWHSAKHGATAGPTTSATGRANLCENVDTLSAQAGNPDVVLLLAGANDIVPATGLTAQQVVNSITNIVAHIATNLPDSKIVVGTQINVESGYNSGNYAHVTNMIPQVNALLKTYVGNLPSGLASKVFLADLNSYVKSGEYAILFDHGSDHLHPDWWGHDQMAEGWLSVITNQFTASQVFPSATVPAAPTTEELGAAAKSELAAYRKGFKLARRIDAASNLDTADPYAATGNGETNGIQKVAYFVEYVRDDNKAHKWVWVDMDAFGDCDLATIGLPATNHQQVVTKLHVKSNHNGIDDVAANDDSVTGFIEFSPFDYNGNVSGVSGAPAGNASCCDWNDTLSDSGTYGCMQVHRVFSPAKSAADGVTRGGQVLFAYNNWRSSTSTAEFGIGNFSSHFYRGANDAQTLDYTYTSGATKMNADAYSVKRIEIWTKKVYGTIFSVW